MSEEDTIKVEKPARGRKWIVRFGPLSDRCDPDEAASVRRSARFLGVEEDELRAAFAAMRVEAVPETPVTRLRVLRQNEEREEIIAVPRTGAAAVLLAAKGAKRVRWDEHLDCAVAVCKFEVNVDRGTGRRVAAEIAVATGATAAYASLRSLELLFEGEDEIPATSRALASLIAVGACNSPYIQQIRFRRSLRPKRWRTKGRPAPLGAVLKVAEKGTHEDVSSTDPRAAAWLAHRGGKEGDRLSHALCPITPEPYDGRDPVVVLEGGIWCHRCAGKLGDGWRSWARIVGAPAVELNPGERDPWTSAADAWVHWEHAKLTLCTPDGLPLHVGGIPTNRLVYEAILAARHPRIVANGSYPDRARDVFNDSLRWVRRHDGQWVHSSTFEKIELRDAEIACLPWVRDQRERVALARSSGPLEGYIPVRPIDVILNPASHQPGIMVVARPGDGCPPPLDPSVEPLDWDSACRVLKRDYPGIRENYLLALICAMACSEAGGPPIILAVIGPTGAGKTQTVGIAASIVRSMFADVTEAFTKDEEYWRRRVGEAMSSGRRPLVVNDVHRVRGLHSHIKGVIGLEDPIEYRPLYGSAVRARCCAPLVLTFVRMPPALHAPEMARRLTYVVIETSVLGDWRRSGPSPQAWRTTPREREKSLRKPPHEWTRIRAAAGVLEKALQVVRDCNFIWPRVAKQLGLNSGETEYSEQGEIDAGLLQDFYQHCRGEHGERVLSESARWPGSRGWVDLSSPAATVILEEFMPDLGGTVDPRHILTQDLQEIDWPKRLGVDAAVRFEGQCRHQTWVGRFTGPGRHGTRPINEKLPAPPEKKDVDDE